MKMEKFFWIKKMIYLFKILLLLKNNNMANLIDIETYSKSILNENKEIRTIIHIGDIHIKNSCERIKEYEYVFNNLYKHIKKIKEKDKTIIVITGDILDSNIEKNCNINTKLFIENICNYIECIIILGNHDITNGQKYNEISKLESVLYNLKTKNPYHLLIKDGSYEFKNIVFGLTTIFNKKVTQIESTKTKIGLYHGTIKEISPNKHQFTNSGNFSINEFKNYDYVLLGDIHKRQKIKNGLYSGSLLQLDPSEDINKGGYIIDLNKKKIEEFNLINDTGFYKIVIDKKGSVKSNIDTKKIPKNAKLIIENNSLNDDMQNKYIKELEDNGINILEKKVVYKINNNLDKEIELLGNKYDLGDLRKKETITEIIKLYLTSEGKITDENKIKRISNQIENIIDTKQNFLRHIKLNKLKINNMAVFGNDTIIDFELLKNNKITNLYGTNDAGKTSVIECLLLAFTGKSSKKGNNNEFIHNKEKKGLLHLELYVNNDKYDIIREYTRKDNKTNCDNYSDGTLSILKNNETVDLKKKNDLEKFIEQNICSLDELLTTSIIEQERNYSLLMSNNKLSLILKYINMNIYNEIIDSCKKERNDGFSEKKKSTSELQNILVGIGDNIDTDSIKKKHKEKLNRLEEEIKTENLDYKILNSEIIELEKEYIKLKTIIDINGDNEVYDEDMVKQKSKEHIEKTKILKEKKKKLTKLKKEYKKIDIDIEEIKKQLEFCVNNIENDNNLKYDIDECNTQIKEKTNKLYKLKNIKSYEILEITNIINNYINYQKNILLDKIKEHEKINNIKNYYTKTHKNIEQEYKEFLNYLELNPVNIQKEISLLENEIIYINNRMKNINTNKKIIDYKQQINNIEKNNIIKNEIDKLTLEINNLKLNLDNIYEMIIKENEKSDILDKHIKTIKKIKEIETQKKTKQLKLEIKEIEIKKLNDKLIKFNIELDKIIKYCEDYDLALNKINDNDIILTIIDKIFIKDMLYKQILNIIEISANKIIKYIGIDEIKIDIRNMNHSIDANIIRKNDKTNILRSGKFYYNCYDIIIRLVLNGLNQTIKQDYLIIDEIMDGVSDSNKNKMIKMFDYFKNYYDWTLIITHDETIRQYIDNSMTIIKENGYSKLL